MARTPLTSRPLDLFYFAFFVIHIPATLCVDLQAFYPADVTPQILKDLMSFYISLTNDPTMQGVLGLTDAKPSVFLWFKSLLYLEALFQLPTFFIGAYGLYHNSRRVWPLLVIYGASTATTLLPVLAMVLAAPGEGGGKESLTVEQRGMLLASYLPFLFLPLFMCVEVATRISRVLSSTPKLKAN
ncbi:transmembrane protein 6/97 [Mrakia frigida]|uniref:Ema19p n=1 Tax=Mrakia frigida TaxID=29902 RepID=UPI003FCBFB79